MMARSSYVYIVVDANGTPVRGFTVKHELAKWLGRNPYEYQVWRIPDGRNGAIANITSDFTDEK